MLREVVYQIFYFAFLVVPVAVALMTPVPLILLFFTNKCIVGSETSKVEKNGSTVTYPIDDKVSATSLINNVSPE